MNLYDSLNKLGEGLYKCRHKYWFLNWLPFKGYIEITRKGECLEAMWCNHKDYHMPCDSSLPSFSVEVNYKDEIKSVYKSIISMHEVRSKEKQQFYYNEMLDKVSILVKRQINENTTKLKGFRENKDSI